MIYFDSSALVKRYLEEDGTDRVNEIIVSAPFISTSKLTYPEMLSAFARKFKREDISEREFRRAANKFETDWDYFLIIEFQNELLSLINKTIKKHYLRGADSLHLASALWLKYAAKENVTFIASDIELLKAAKLERLQIINPVEYTKQ